MNDIADQIVSLRKELPMDVTLVAVSKFHPIEALRCAYDAGQRVFGESRVQELCVKYPQMPNDVEWHFIGHLQTNKVRQIVPFVSLIHSIDSIKLLDAVNVEAVKAGRRVDVLLQLHVAKEETKFGFTPNECIDLVKSGKINSLNGVKIRGVMGMATNTEDTAEIEAEFDAIREVFNVLKESVYSEDPLFDIVSMGMSDDYKLAIAHGGNMVRIGSSIFGMREY